MRLLKLLYCTSILLLFATSCSTNTDKAKSYLAREAAATQNECPISLGTNGILQSVEYNSEENALVMTYIMNPTYVNFDDIRINETEYLRNIANFLKSEINAELLNNLSKAGASLKTIYSYGDTIEPLILELDATDITDISASKQEREEAIEILREIIAEIQCPQTNIYGHNIVNIELKENCLVYTYQVTDTFSLDTDQKIGEFRAGLITELRNDNRQESISLIQLVNQANYNLRYQLIMYDNSQIVIDIAPYEIID